jgi:hypothetical protein
VAGAGVATGAQLIKSKAKTARADMVLNSFIIALSSLNRMDLMVELKARNTLLMRIDHFPKHLLSIHGY